MMRIYSKSHPDGVLKDSAVLPIDIRECVEASGVYRGSCPCCDKVIVVRFAGERSTMSAGDEHFLLHEGATP